MKSAQTVFAILVKLDCLEIKLFLSFFFFFKEICSIMYALCVRARMHVYFGFCLWLCSSKWVSSVLVSSAVVPSFSVFTKVFFSVKYRLMSCFLMHSYLLCSVDAPVTKSSSSYSGGPRIQRQEQVILLSPKKGSQVGSRLLHITALKNDTAWYLYTKGALSALYNTTNISLTLS